MGDPPQAIADLVKEIREGNLVHGIRHRRIVQRTILCINFM